MSRRAVNSSRRLVDSGSIPLSSSLGHKSRISPSLSVALVLLGAFILIAYTYGGGSSGSSSEKYSSNADEGVSCALEVQRSIPFVKKAYGDSTRKILHVGPESCSMVSNLLNEGDIEAWGVEPYDLEDADVSCKTLVRKGIVRVADLKFPLPYREKSFSLVIVSDAFDYLSPKQLNKTLLDLARVSTDGLVTFVGYPVHQKSKVPELSKFGRPAKFRSSSSWIKFFLQTGFEVNEAAAKKFEQVASKKSYKPGCQVFHLSS